MSNERRLFGTDGIRGRFGVAPIDVETVFKLGWATGSVLRRTLSDDATAAETLSNGVLVARDTRESGLMLERAFAAGLELAGMMVSLAGVLPTPAVAHLTRSGGYAAGMMITASHNPFHDNGIKFFSPLGIKLDDALEQAIEHAFAGAPPDMATSCQQALDNTAQAQSPSCQTLNAYAQSYQHFCLTIANASLPEQVALAGNLTIVVDCANGAMSAIAPVVLRALGANVVVMHATPDGQNINVECGSNHPHSLKNAVLKHQADLGIAFDGDGDRVLLVDATGALVDGDQILYILAMQAQANNTLQGGVVGTQMTNMGLELSLKASQIPFTRTRVGDRYVIEQMLAEQWSLGGEGSGHIICLEAQPTGDGLVGALKVLQAMYHSQKDLAALAKPMQKLPQTLINVSASRALVSHPALEQACHAVEQQLNGRGRVLLRASGTEPLIRVMVEGEDAVLAESFAQEIAEVVQSLAAKQAS